MTAWKPGQKLVLETDNFSIRSLMAADATDTYISWWNDAQIQESLGFAPRNWDRPRAVQHIERFDNARRFHLGIFPKGRSEPIGFMSLFVEPADKVMTNIVIGDKDYWGKKVVIEVRVRVFDWIMETLNANKIYGRVNARNFASIYNYKTQGFKMEGVLRDHGIGHDGTRHDLIFFGLLRSEWLARRDAAAPKASSDG